ncbi:L-glyceraldehyde 3-phosphate reductase [Lacticigenium naphthae]|uniref:L-glyceraldehyde 3-phosphate reductase n=1 Tax=Lacticigenium naphthae TaxID=515351 RepID=UPI000405F2CF|nr:L-glyceraldehyde 3-phosphate reductase [Lacticigenium naphthae]
MVYQASTDRYDKMIYNRVGNSGLKLPALSLGMWHNFGHVDLFEKSQKVVRRAFDLGITHFDLANNYGPPAGSAEENFGKILKKDFLPYRDEMIISSKAGFYMWEGPYGDYGSKKSLTASLDQSLNRMGLDYVDIFYHHRPDPDTNLEETAQALDLFVRQGKALYVGVSNYNAEQTEEIIKLFNDMKTPFVIHQPSYSMYNRWVEDGLTDVLNKYQKGAIAYSPLAQGMLTDRYLGGVDEDSRAARESSAFLTVEDVNKQLDKTRKLNEIAKERNQSLAQMAIAWLLRDGNMTSVLIGVSKISQLEDNVEALKNIQFSQTELNKIEKILAS